MDTTIQPGHRVTDVADLLALPHDSVVELRDGEIARLAGDVMATYRDAYVTDTAGSREIGEQHLPATVLKLGQRAVDRVGPPPEQILALRMEVEHGVVSVAERLVDLLVIVWSDPIGFDGKRPWGFTAWRQDFYGSMVEAGFLVETDRLPSGTMTLSPAERRRADRLIIDAISCLAEDRTPP
ncbi:hypothetical protein [Nocardia sp. NPDC050710]|uniref:hypothetical protein n=1 Tax=Nocardia sp. NPDC050710 TaxID=3157220 RepID=UPI0033CA428B